MAPGLHAPCVPLPCGVRRHPQEDRDPQEVTSQECSASVCNALKLSRYNSHQTAICYPRLSRKNLYASLLKAGIKPLSGFIKDIVRFLSGGWQSHKITVL